jgi:hypothetical protein
MKGPSGKRLETAELLADDVAKSSGTKLGMTTEGANRPTPFRSSTAALTDMKQSTFFRMAGCIAQSPIKVGGPLTTP